MKTTSHPPSAAFDPGAGLPPVLALVDGPGGAAGTEAAAKAIAAAFAQAGWSISPQTAMALSGMSRALGAAGLVIGIGGSAPVRDPRAVLLETVEQRRLTVDQTFEALRGVIRETTGWPDFSGERHRQMQAMEGVQAEVRRLLTAGQPERASGLLAATFEALNLRAPKHTTRQAVARQLAFAEVAGSATQVDRSKFEMPWGPSPASSSQPPAVTAPPRRTAPANAAPVPPRTPLTPSQVVHITLARTPGLTASQREALARVLTHRLASQNIGDEAGAAAYLRRLHDSPKAWAAIFYEADRSLPKAPGSARVRVASSRAALIDEAIAKTPGIAPSERQAWRQALAEAMQRSGVGPGDGAGAARWLGHLRDSPAVLTAVGLRAKQLVESGPPKRQDAGAAQNPRPGGGNTTREPPRVARADRPQDDPRDNPPTAPQAVTTDEAMREALRHYEAQLSRSRRLTLTEEGERLAERDARDAARHHIEHQPGLTPQQRQLALFALDAELARRAQPVPQSPSPGEPLDNPDVPDPAGRVRDLPAQGPHGPTRFEVSGLGPQPQPDPPDGLQPAPQITQFVQDQLAAVRAAGTPAQQLQRGREVLRDLLSTAYSFPLYPKISNQLAFDRLPLSTHLTVIDAQGLKWVNDTARSHDVGDAFLQQVALTLDRVTLSMGVENVKYYHLGGSRFVISGSEPDLLDEITRRVTAELEGTRIDLRTPGMAYQVPGIKVVTPLLRTDDYDSRSALRQAIDVAVRSESDFRQRPGGDLAARGLAPLGMSSSPTTGGDYGVSFTSSTASDADLQRPGRERRDPSMLLRMDIESVLQSLTLDNMEERLAGAAALAYGQKPDVNGGLLNVNGEKRFGWTGGVTVAADIESVGKLNTVSWLLGDSLLQLGFMNWRQAQIDTDVRFPPSHPSKASYTVAPGGDEIRAVFETEEAARYFAERVKLLNDASRINGMTGGMQVRITKIRAYTGIDASSPTADKKVEEAKQRAIEDGSRNPSDLPPYIRLGPGP